MPKIELFANIRAREFPLAMVEGYQTTKSSPSGPAISEEKSGGRKELG